MGHFCNNPDRDFDESRIAEVIKNFNVCFNEHLDEGGIQFDHLKQGLQKIVKTSFADKFLKLVKNFVHPSQKYFLVARKPLYQVYSIFYQFSLLSCVSRSLCQTYYSVQNHFRIILICNLNQKIYRTLSQCVIIRLKALNQGHLPLLNHFWSRLCQINHCVQPKRFQIVITISEEALQSGFRFLQQILMRINIGNSLNALLHDPLVEVHVAILGSLETLLQNIIHQFALIHVIMTKLLKHSQKIDLDPWSRNFMIIILGRVFVIDYLPQNLSQFSSLIFKGDRIESNQLFKYRQSPKQNRNLWVTQPYHSQLLDIFNEVGIFLVHVVDEEQRFSPNHRQFIFHQFAHNWQDICHQIFIQKITKHCQDCEVSENIVRLQVLHYGVVHQDSQLLPWAHQHRRQQI